MNIFKKITKRINNIFYYKKLKKNNVFIDNSAIVDRNTLFEGYNKIMQKTVVLNSSLGIGTYIHRNSDLEKCKIGKWCSIAPEVKIIKGNHPTRKYVSTYPLFYSKRFNINLNFKTKNTFDEFSYVDGENKWFCEIGNDVWIGEKSSIINGVKIGNGAIVAAGSVVTKDVPPYAIVGCVPAKIIRYRFSDEQIKKLEKIQWWNKDIIWLNKNADLFNDIETFLEEI